MMEVAQRTDQEQTPLETVKRGLSKGQQLAEIIGFNHVKGTLDNLRRISHARRLKLLGLEGTNADTGGDDMIVQGDYKVDITTSQPAEAEAPAKSTLLPKLLLAGAALAVGGIPFNGRTLLQHVMGAALSPVEAFHDTDTDTTIGLGSIDELKSDK